MVVAMMAVANNDDGVIMVVERMLVFNACF